MYMYRYVDCQLPFGLATALACRTCPTLWSTCHFFGVSMATIVTVCDAGATPQTNFNNRDSDSSGALALQI